MRRVLVSNGLGVSLIWRLRESLAVAFFKAAHGPQQMAIHAGPELLRLAVQGLHHERVENADLFQCFHVAMNAGESCVKTVKEIVDLRFGYTAGIRHTAKIRGSHRLPFFGR